MLDALKNKKLSFFGKKDKNSFSDFEIPTELPQKAYGFKDKKALTTLDHIRHMQELGYKTPKEYEQGAIDFWEKADGDIYFGHQRKRFYKYNVKLNLMLVISPDGTIHTFYRIPEKKFKKVIIQERLQIWKK